MPKGARRIHGAGVSRREALLFEAGIKLGGVFHQYIGIPVTTRTAPGLARAIENAVGLQPYVRAVRVAIVPSRGGRVGRGRFAYRYLTAEMLEVRIDLVDGPNRARVRLANRPDLRYPLMVVESAVGPSASQRGKRSAAVRSDPVRARKRGRSAPRNARSVVSA